MRKRTVKFILESIIIVVICVIPLIVYGLRLSNGDITSEPGEDISIIEPVQVYSSDTYTLETIFKFGNNSGFGNNIQVWDNSNYDNFLYNISWTWRDDLYTYGIVVIDNTDNPVLFVPYYDLGNYYGFSFCLQLSSLSEGLNFPSTFYVDTNDSSIYVLQDNVIPIYDNTFESFIKDFCGFVFLDEGNIFYYTFDYFFGESSVFGLNILTSGSLLYIAFICTVYLAWLVFDFILFIPKLCRKWLCKLTQSE